MSHITNGGKLDHSVILTELDDAYDHHDTEWIASLSEIEAIRCIAGSLRSIEYSLASIAASLAAQRYGDMYPD